MGTEPARLQERLEAALGPAWGIERELGGGGMSRVFLVNDARLGRRIVLKVLHADLAADVSARRSDREVRLAARLQHPHVVHTLTEVGTEPGTPAYMVPEQVTGDPAMDHCADLYALGMMAYELLVGSHPFAGRAHHAAVVMRLLAKHAADRRETPGGRSCTRFGRERRGLTLPPRRDCDADAGLRGQLVCAAATIRGCPATICAAATAVCAAATVPSRFDNSPRHK